MRDQDSVTANGLPDAGGLNIDYQDAFSFEPSDDQLEMVLSDVKAIADGVRTHLTDQFTVSARIERTPNGLHGHVIVEFPTGDAIGPGIPITSDMFDGADDPDWNGPIPPEDRKEMCREIVQTAVVQWANLLEHAGDRDAMPAS